MRRSKALGVSEATISRDLAAILPADVRLESLTLNYGARLELDLRVVARGAAAYDLFLKRCQESPLFRDVVPGAENRDGEVATTVRAAYRAGEAR